MNEKTEYKECSITNLPVEIIAMILDNLPLSERIRNRRVCQSWNYAIEKLSFTKQRSLKLFSSKNLMKSYDDFCYEQKVTVMNSDNSYLTCLKDRLITPAISDKGEQLSIFLNRFFPKLYHLTLSCDDIFRAGLDRILNCSRNIRSLAIMDYYLCSMTRFFVNSSAEFLTTLNAIHLDSLLVINLQTSRTSLEHFSPFPIGTLGPLLYELRIFSTANCLVPFDRILRKLNGSQIKKINIQILEVSLRDLRESIVESHLLEGDVSQNLTHFGAQMLLVSNYESSINEKTLEIICQFKNLIYLDMTFAHQMPLHKSLPYLYSLKYLCELRLSIGQENLNDNHRNEIGLLKKILTLKKLYIDLHHSNTMKNFSYILPLTIAFPNVQFVKIEGRKTINAWYFLLIPELRQELKNKFRQKLEGFSKLNRFEFFERSINFI